MLVVCGGIVPPADHTALAEAGVAAVFGPGSRVPDIAARLLELLSERAARVAHG